MKKNGGTLIACVSLQFLQFASLCQAVVHVYAASIFGHDIIPSRIPGKLVRRLGEACRRRNF